METTRDLVRLRLQAALDEAQASGRLPTTQAAEGTAFEIVRPTNPEHGDFATNLALKLAAALKQPPRQVAEALVAALDTSPTDPLLARAEVAGPGFVNLWLTARHVESSVDAIRTQGSGYGRTRVDNGRDRKSTRLN